MQELKQRKSTDELKSLMVDKLELALKFLKMGSITTASYVILSLAITLDNEGIGESLKKLGSE